MDIKHIYHLYRRAAFGILPVEAEAKSSMSRKEVVNELFKASRDYTPLTIDQTPFDKFFARDLDRMTRRKEFVKTIENNKTLRLNFAGVFMDRMLNPIEPLNERMTLFWMNVFVCRDNVPPYIQRYNNVLRENALGNFKKFVLAVAKEPAMMRYLNTNQNLKGHPNENFARELMELFTLGPGNYTEDDIKEAARAFTGWAHRIEGDFYFRTRQHDYGTKSFMGWEADLDGEDIIAIITKKPECAQFICTKLYRYFVNEKVNPAHVLEMAEVFYRHYDIKDVMHFLFMSDWFYDEENIGSKIKSPMDFLASMHLVVPYRFTAEKEMVFLQRLLGQVPLDPPNVAGWEGGKSWIDTNTIMTRLKLPSLLLGKGMIPTGTARDRFIEMSKRPYGNRLKVSVDWEAFDAMTQGLSEEKLIDMVLAGSQAPGTVDLISGLKKQDKRDFVMQLMSLPEFQLT